MTVPNALTPAKWQVKAVNGIVARMSGRGAARAALLQLPTGFGKSLVAASVYERLRRLTPGLRLVVVLPRKEVPSGWRRALGFSEVDEIEFGAELSIPGRRGRVQFENKRALTAAVVARGGGQPTTLARALHRGRCLVVVDELHRHAPFVDAMSWVSMQRPDQGRAAESALTTPFRSPERGRRSWPRWLLLSATPFNPVQLDRVDPEDFGGASDTWEPDAENDEEVLASELDRVLSALCELAGVKRGTWLDAHIAAVGERLSSQTGVHEILPPRELLVWPRTVRSDAFAAPRQPRLALASPKSSGPALDMAVRELVRVAEALHRVRKRGAPRWATAERFLLSAGRVRLAPGKVEGVAYCEPLRRCLREGRKVLPRTKGKYPTKLRSLVSFVRCAGRQHILVFCIHQAVAIRVTAVLARELNEKSAGSMVRCGLGRLSPDTYDWFNDPSVEGDRRRILVATDASSESVDLHRHANVLVHYELPWSPLRVLQRVGRLWRLRENEMEEGKSPRTPQLPAIAHFAHPGSADEEILNRLHRRWGHLKALGLAFLDERQALGTRWPAVPTTAEQYARAGAVRGTG